MGGKKMKKEEKNVKNKPDLDSKPGLFTVAEAFQRILALIERAKIENAEGQLQKEELKRAIEDILQRTELRGPILPYGWERFNSVEELEMIITKTKILFTKPDYIV
jgi:hypothetical protein